MLCVFALEPEKKAGVVHRVAGRAGNLYPWGRRGAEHVSPEMAGSEEKGETRLGRVCPLPPPHSTSRGRPVPPWLAGQGPRERICGRHSVRMSGLRGTPLLRGPHRDGTVLGCVCENENNPLIQAYPNEMKHFPNHKANALFSQAQSLIGGCVFCLPGFI